MGLATGSVTVTCAKRSLVVGRWSLVVVRCSLFVGRGSLFVVRWSLFVVRCSLFVVRWSLAVGCWLSLVVVGLLSSLAGWLLAVVGHRWIVVVVGLLSSLAGLLLVWLWLVVCGGALKSKIRSDQTKKDRTPWTNEQNGPPFGCQWLFIGCDCSLLPCSWLLLVSCGGVAFRCCWDDRPNAFEVQDQTRTERLQLTDRRALFCCTKGRRWLPFRPNVSRAAVTAQAGRAHHGGRYISRAPCPRRAWC